jgi:hypothetical protein
VTIAIPECGEEALDFFLSELEDMFWNPLLSASRALTAACLSSFVGEFPAEALLAEPNLKC